MSPDKGKYHIPKEEPQDDVLPNKLNIKELQKLGEAEAEGFSNAELDLIEELTDKTIFDTAYIRDIHRRALNHLYTFAGEYRSVNMSKGGFMFAAARVIPNAMEKFEREVLLDLSQRYHDKENLIYDIGKTHAELLFIHPFRDGNGRAMRTLANLMSYKQGYREIDFKQIDIDAKMRTRYLKSVQAAAQEDYQPMIGLIGELFPLD